MPIAPLLLVLLIALPIGNAPAGAQSIPPGQEELLAAMLGSGAQLPDGCSFADGQVERDVVRATYHCLSGVVLLQLSHQSARSAGAIITKQFALTVVSGSPHEDLLRAIETRIRARESEFEWSMLTIGKSGRGFSPVFGLPSWFFVLLLLGLATASAISGARAWATRMPLARWLVVESLVVAAVVGIWLRINADPPAHMDTGIDVALARDCIISEGFSCLGHAASAIGLVQGQAFTYALAAWLYLGLTMRELSLLAAGVHGAATGLLHHAVARRFGGVAWVVSVFVSALGPFMTGYPVIWNPSWFVLPLTVAFLATLASVNGSGMWSVFVAGVAFAFTSESHLLFGAFVAVAAVIVLIAARRGLVAATVLVSGFVLTELVISPVSFTMNARILRGWLGAHPVPVGLTAVLLVTSMAVQPRLRRAIRDHPEVREPVAVLFWLVAGAVGLGVVLPWAVSRPLQVRYFGAAFPAIGYAAGWLLDAATFRARSVRVRAVAIVIFAAVFAKRMTNTQTVEGSWLMDDGRDVGTSARLANVSALDIQLMVRSIPGGALAPAAAAFVGTADAPVFPGRIVRAVQPRADIQPPSGWSRIRLARREILTSDIDAWTHPEEAEVCPEPATVAPCITLTRDDFDEVARSAGGLLHRVFGLRIARSATRIAEWAQRGVRTLLWKIPLRATGSDDTHDIVFPDGSGEQIVDVDGTRWTARSDTHAAVERPAGDAAASMTVRTPIDSFEAGIAPMPFELRPGEADVLRDILPPDEHG